MEDVFCGSPKWGGILAPTALNLRAGHHTRGCQNSAGTLITTERDFTVCITYEVPLVAGGQRLYRDATPLLENQHLWVTAMAGSRSKWQ